MAGLVGWVFGLQAASSEVRSPPSPAPWAEGVKGDEPSPAKCGRGTAIQDNSRRVAHTLPDFDGKCARMGMASCHITVISPSNTVGHIASYVVPNASMRRLRNRP